MVLDALYTTSSRGPFARDWGKMAAKFKMAGVNVPGGGWQKITIQYNDNLFCRIKVFTCILTIRLIM